MPFGLSQLIVEDVAALRAQEKEARAKGQADRLRLLRFVKEGRVSAAGEAAVLLGYHEQTIQRFDDASTLGVMLP